MSIAQYFDKHIDLLDVTSKNNRKVPGTCVKESTISDCGLGLYAEENIEKGLHIGWYYGKVFIEYPHNNSQYILNVHSKPSWVSDDIWKNRIPGHGIFIDGDPVYSTNKDDDIKYRLGRLNHKTNKHINAKFLSNGRLVATKKIRKGCEIFINYGDDYFE